MTVMQGVRVTVAAVGRGYPKTAVTTVTAVTPKDGHPPKERRNPPMPYAILRFQKRKAGGVAACERHNERKKEAYKSNPDIDMERSKNNYHLIAPPKYTYKKEINRMVAEAGCRTSFIVQYRITKLLKSTLFVKLPAIRFHILTSFLVGKLVVLPPFSRGNTAFFKNAEDFLKFLQKFFERTKCARPKSPDGRIGIVSSIQMIRQFIYISVVSPGGGRAFFDKSITVGFCRYAFCFMAATSFSRRFQQ